MGIVQQLIVPGGAEDLGQKHIGKAGGQPGFDDLLLEHQVVGAIANVGRNARPRKLGEDLLLLIARQIQRYKRIIFQLAQRVMAAIGRRRVLGEVSRMGGQVAEAACMLLDGIRPDKG